MEAVTITFGILIILLIIGGVHNNLLIAAQKKEIEELKETIDELNEDIPAYRVVMAADGIHAVPITRVLHAILDQMKVKVHYRRSGIELIEE